MSDKIYYQEIFNKVKKHLLTQARPSLRQTLANAVECAYRGDDGTKCAVGCLITDEAYAMYGAEIEGCSVSVINTLNNRKSLMLAALQMSNIPTDSATLRFLTALQQVHDFVCSGADYYSRIDTELRRLAAQCGLQYE
jgi:hypothetical protein